MTRVLTRRAQHAFATTNDLMPRSKWIIWCFEPENVPAMIDLLIQRGSLSESDRQNCVHWTAITEGRSLTDKEISLSVDADEMLDAAGIRTLSGQAWDALLQSADALKALLREHYGELDAEDDAWIAERDRNLERTGLRARTVKRREHPQTCLPACK